MTISPAKTGSLDIFMSLPDKIFCIGLSSHSWASGKFVYARYARYANSNALLRLRLSRIDVFCPHFVRAKNQPSGLERLSSPRQILYFEEISRTFIQNHVKSFRIFWKILKGIYKIFVTFQNLSKFLKKIWCNEFFL